MKKATATDAPQTPGWPADLRPRFAGTDETTKRPVREWLKRHRVHAAEAAGMLAGLPFDADVLITEPEFEACRATWRSTLAGGKSNG